MMTIFIPKLFDLTGDEKKISYTYRKLCGIAEQTPNTLIAYIDCNGKGTLTYQANEQEDASLHLTTYASVSPQFQSQSYTYTTLAGLCTALGIGTTIDYDKALAYFANKNSLSETITMYPFFIYAKKNYGTVEFIPQFNTYYIMLDQLDANKNSADYCKLLDQLAVMYLKRDFVFPFIIEPYDEIFVFENQQCVRYGLVPVDKLQRKDDMLAALYNSAALTQYMTGICVANPEGHYKNAAILFHRAYHTATTVGPKSMIQTNMEDLEEKCRGTAIGEMVSTLSSEISKDLDIFCKNMRNNPPAQSIQQQSIDNAPKNNINLSDKEILKQYFTKIQQSELQRYRICEQIKHLMTQINTRPESLKPFEEDTSRTNHRGESISEETLFKNNCSSFVKWSLQYSHIKANEKIIATQNEYYLATAECMTKLLPEINSILDKLYAYDIIPPKYRTLIAVTTINEYFQNGRVDSIKEAINLFEQEVRQQIVTDSIQQLQLAVQNMHQDIIQNQKAMYQTLCETQTAVEHLSNEVKFMATDYANRADKTNDLLQMCINQNESIARDNIAIKDSLNWIVLNECYFKKIK